MLETIVRQGIIVPIGMHEGKRIVFASDHRGYALKKSLISYAEILGYAVSDVGTNTIERCDYPNFAAELGKEVSKNFLKTVGVAICGSGIGMTIVAGKFPSVYPARCLTLEDAIMSRKHNNSNVLVLNSQMTDDFAKVMLSKWMTTPFYEGPDDEPYLRRYLKIVSLERRLYL